MRRFTMLQRPHAAFCFLSFAICAVCLPWIAGCGSEQAGATSSETTGTPRPDPTVSSAASASAAKPRVPLRPGAKTRVLAAAGDRSYDKTFDDLRFDMTVREAVKS